MEKKVLSPEEKAKEQALKTCFMLCNKLPNADEYSITRVDNAIEIYHEKKMAFFAPADFVRIAVACRLSNYFTIAGLESEEMKLMLRIF